MLWDPDPFLTSLAAREASLNASLLAIQLSPFAPGLSKRKPNPVRGDGIGLSRGDRGGGTDDNDNFLEPVDGNVSELCRSALLPRYYHPKIRTAAFAAFTHECAETLPHRTSKIARTLVIQSRSIMRATMR